jgi:hypothetical protein
MLKNILKTNDIEDFQNWTSEEIDKYVDKYHILVLFSTSKIGKASMEIFGNLSNTHKQQLFSLIANLFGGNVLSIPIRCKINEFAIKWYNKKLGKEKK